MLLVVQNWVDGGAQRCKKRAEEHASDVKKNEEVLRKLKKRKEQYEGEWWVILCNSVTVANKASVVYITISTSVQWACPLVLSWNVVNCWSNLCLE